MRSYYHLDRKVFFLQGLHAIGLDRDRVLHLSLHKRSYRTSHLESSTCPLEQFNAICSELISATVNVNDISPISSPVSPPVCTIFMFLKRAASHIRTLQLDKHKTHCKLKKKKERERKRKKQPIRIPAIKNDIQHTPNPSPSSRDQHQKPHSLTHLLRAQPSQAPSSFPPPT